MQLQLLTFPAELNIGLQVGDIVYYSPTLPSSNFNTINSVGTSLTGYYADVEFENHSTGKIELFAIGSEVSESSK